MSSTVGRYALAVTLKKSAAASILIAANAENFICATADQQHNPRHGPQEKDEETHPTGRPRA